MGLLLHFLGNPSTLGLSVVYFVSATNSTPVVYFVSPTTSTPVVCFVSATNSTPVVYFVSATNSTPVVYFVSLFCECHKQHSSCLFCERHKQHSSCLFCEQTALQLFILWAPQTALQLFCECHKQHSSCLFCKCHKQHSSCLFCESHKQHSSCLFCECHKQHSSCFWNRFLNLNLCTPLKTLITKRRYRKRNRPVKKFYFIIWPVSVVWVTALLNIRDKITKQQQNTFQTRLRLDVFSDYYEGGCSEDSTWNGRYRQYVFRYKTYFITYVTAPKTIQNSSCHWYVREFTVPTARVHMV